MARAIDADKLVEKLRLIATCWSISPFVSKEQHCGAVNMLREVERELKEAPTLTPPNEWVSVEEKLPPPKQNVLAYSPESGIAEADYGDGVWMQYRWSAVMRGVTHWMPLPASPDKDNNAPGKTPNEPLTCEGCDMQGEKVTPCASCIRDPRVCDYYTSRPPEKQEANNDGD